MKKLIALLLVLVMALTMVACAAKTNAPKADMPANDTKTDMPATVESKTEAPAGKIKVGFVTQSLTNASQAYAWTQFQKYAPEYGFEVTLFDEDYDSQNGVAAISTCIAEGYTAICLNPTDPAALVPALKEAKEAGIIIGLYSSDLPDESKQYRDFMCGTNDFLFGEIAAQTMMAAFPNGVKMVEVGGQSGHDAQIKRHDGFMSAINDSVTVLDSKDVAQWATEDAMAIMEDFISLYGDEIQAVFCHWDTGATGVIQALKNAGIEGVYVIGIDGCGVPVYAVPFHAIASSFLRLQCPELIEDEQLQEAAARNCAMLHRYPNTIAGENVVCSILTADPDVLGKSGAAGVYAMGIRSLGIGIAAKVLDGSHDEYGSLPLHICRQLGYETDTTRKLAQCYSDVIRNSNGDPIGIRKAVFSLTPRK